MTKKVVALYAVGWIKDHETNTRTPKVFEGSAFESAKEYTGRENNRLNVEDGYDAGCAFSYRNRVRKEELAGLGIGFTPKEAVDLAFVREVARRQEALDLLNSADRNMTDLMRLEVAMTTKEKK